MPNNSFLKSLKHAKDLSINYDVPKLDILMMALNMEGINCKDISSERVRFKMDIGGESYFLALTNTNKSRWIYSDGNIFFENLKIGKSKECLEDTCDNTYFRRFVKNGSGKNGTVITMNSNNRGNCSGCQFCGTYNLNPKDSDEKNLTSPSNLSKKINSILIEENIPDLSHLFEVGVVTGCFSSESATLDHLIMINDTLRKNYNFMGELKYVGSQIVSSKGIDTFAKYINPGALYLTAECFTRRDMLLKPSKRISLEKGRDILGKAKEKNIDTSLLYIMGLDPLNIFEKEMKKYIPVLTRFPVINTMQEYVPGQNSLRHPSANNLEYYLLARKILENEFKEVPLMPRIWENYRGMFFSKYGGVELNGIKI